LTSPNKFRAVEFGSRQDFVAAKYRTIQLYTHVDDDDESLVFVSYAGEVYVYWLRIDIAADWPTASIGPLEGLPDVPRAALEI